MTNIFINWIHMDYPCTLIGNLKYVIWRQIRRRQCHLLVIVGVTVESGSVATEDVLQFAIREIAPLWWRHDNQSIVGGVYPLVRTPVNTTHVQHKSNISQFRSELPHIVVTLVISIVSAARDSHLCLSTNMHFMNRHTLRKFGARRKYSVPYFKSPGWLQLLS